MDQAHESNVWALAYHPMGHILCTGSNDHTTRFWCRDRPGEGVSGSGTGAGGVEESTEEDGGYDALPGFGASEQHGHGQPNNPNDWEMGMGGVRASVGGWDSGQGGDEFIPGFGKSTLPPGHDSTGGGGGGGSGRAPPPPGFGMDDAYEGRGGGGRGGQYGGGGGNGYGHDGRDRERDYGYQRGGRGGGGGRGGRGGRRWD